MYPNFISEIPCQTFDQLVGQQVSGTDIETGRRAGQDQPRLSPFGSSWNWENQWPRSLAKRHELSNPYQWEPCNDCYICESITNGGLEDVIEDRCGISNGVDEIQDIRTTKSTYAPSLQPSIRFTLSMSSYAQQELMY